MADADVKYDEHGLVPAIVQDATTGAVLMLAYMNAEALRLTRETGEVTFWSRSRKSLWKKGETSGNTLAHVDIQLDCDADALLVRARPAGPTCHTGTTTCWGDAPVATIVDALEHVIAERRASTADKSYTKSLFDKGMPKILEKIAEEHGELAAELPSGDDGKVIHETADLLFHVMVGLAARDIPVAKIYAELARRFGTSGHVEKAGRSK
jgi:phosphoribosyl-ATP pyrophosphohydrolase/phosphoribosyl-AMP cyclohydrolase